MKAKARSDAELRDELVALWLELLQQGCTIQGLSVADAPRDVLVARLTHERKRVRALAEAE